MIKRGLIFSLMVSMMACCSSLVADDQGVVVTALPSTYVSAGTQTEKDNFESVALKYLSKNVSQSDDKMRLGLILAALNGGNVLSSGKKLTESEHSFLGFVRDLGLTAYSMYQFTEAIEMVKESLNKNVVSLLRSYDMTGKIDGDDARRLKLWFRRMQRELEAKGILEELKMLKPNVAKAYERASQEGLSEEKEIQEIVEFFAACVETLQENKDYSCLFSTEKILLPMIEAARANVTGFEARQRYDKLKKIREHSGIFAEKSNIRLLLMTGLVSCWNLYAMFK